ncbi:MAG: hypothetical protein J7515_16665 [Caulobacter sp.]|nr:hypothetical protein [Caulobacter sp.]
MATLFAAGAGSQAAADEAGRRVSVRTTIYETDATPTSSVVDCDATQPTSAWRSWREGGEYDRAQALDVVRALRRAGDIDLVEEGAGCLRRYYALRAGRQQSVLDIGSNVVFVGGLGAVLSAGAGATTQRDWAYAAVLPVVMAQFRASQPTRDLYAGGKIGLGVIGARYRELDKYTSLLGDALRVGDSAKVAPDSAFKQACDRLQTIEGWEAGEDRTALLPDYRKLKQACVASGKAHTDLFSAWQAAQSWRRAYAYAYSTDLIRLDDEILSKDRQLRYSPVQTLSAMAAAPFSAAATLLSSENGTQAVDRLKTQQAFSNMEVPLSSIVLPPCPPQITEIYQLSDAALIRGTVTTARGEKQPTFDQVKDTLERMQAAADALNSASAYMNYRIRLATTIVALAAYDRLAFGYDANTARISVALASSPPSTTPVSTSPATGR